MRKPRRLFASARRHPSSAMSPDGETIEDLEEAIEVLRDIEAAAVQLAKGRSLPHGEARRQALARLQALLSAKGAFCYSPARRAGFAIDERICAL